jgi:nucleoside-diphosphate-sugar epimerase
MRVLLTVLALALWSLPANAAHVLIFGATQNTGLETAKILVARGDTVTAFVRESSDTTALNQLGVTQVVGDALDEASVDAAFAAGSYDAVVTTLSGGRRNTDVDSQGNIHVFAAAEAAGVRRVILVTAIGSGGTENVLEEGARRFLKPVLDAKTVAEDDLQGRNLEWTILRPGQLPDGEATGRGLLSEDQTLMGRITRGELAALIVKCIDDPGTAGKIFHTVDADAVGSFSSFD